MANRENKDDQSKEDLPRNAARDYGVDDDKTNRESERIEEVRRSHVQLINNMQREGSVASQKRELEQPSRSSSVQRPNSQAPEEQTRNTQSVSNSRPHSEYFNPARGYGLEDHRSTREDPRVSTIKSPLETSGETNVNRNSRKPEQARTVEAQVPNELPREVPTEVPRPVTRELPKEVQTETPREVPRQVPSELPSEVPREGPTEVPRPVTRELPKEVQTEAPREVPKEVPRQAPSELPREMPKELPREVPREVQTMDIAAPATSTKPTRTQDLDKSTNTDVTFDPSKIFASKMTNTSDFSSEDAVLDNNILDLNRCFEMGVSIVRRAGLYALEANKESLLYYITKQHSHDLLTSTDTEVEHMIVNFLQNEFPDHKFIGEEAISGSETGVVELTNEPTWIIDPIDGTMNFIHHFPYYCVSVALIVNKVTVIGIVFNPAMNEFYSARQGSGAYLNGERIRTSGQSDLSQSLVLQEYSSGMNTARAEVLMQNTQRLIKQVHALRSIGSSALGLVMVASGVVDAFYHFGLHVWDMAAAILIVIEAGGTVMDPAGDEIDIMSRRVLAASTLVLAENLSIQLAQNYPQPRDDQSKVDYPNEYSVQMVDFNMQTDFSEDNSSIDESLRGASAKQNKSRLAK